MMRPRRDLALVVGVVLALGLLVLLLGPAGAGDDGDPRLSTYLSGHDGARALFLTLDELGIPAHRRLQPWDADDPSEGPREARVVLAAPRAPTPRELDAMLEWIRGGGTLFYGVPGWSDPLAEALGLRTQSAAPETLGPIEQVRWAERRSDGVEARPAASHPWTEGVERVAGFHRLFDAEVQRLEGAEVLLATEEGTPAVVMLAVGEGRVLAWSDPWVLSNGRLREGEGALLFARAARAVSGEGAALAFDEYHQGFRADGGPALALRRFLTDTGAGRWLLQAGVAALALLLLAGARLGMPLPEADTRRRSPLEHVEAVSAAYRKAGARSTARRLLLAGLDRDLGRKWPRLLEASPGGGDGSPARRRIGEARAREQGRAEGEEDLVALAAAVDEFVREVRGWKRPK